MHFANVPLRIVGNRLVVTREYEARRMLDLEEALTCFRAGLYMLAGDAADMAVTPLDEPQRLCRRYGG